MFFTTISMLPRPAARWVRAAIFNGLFASGTPWPYSDCSYEGAKRRHLVSVIPGDARVIVEIGCADGHNIEAMAAQLSLAHVIGVDISDRACAMARQRINDNPLLCERVDVVHADIATLCTGHGELEATVDVIVLSEVLYYFGSGRTFADQLRPLGRLLAEDGYVIAVHTCDDAPALHAALAKALNIAPRSEDEVTVAGQTYTVSVLSRPSAPWPSAPGWNRYPSTTHMPSTTGSCGSCAST
jgi:spermidine synthase